MLIHWSVHGCLELEWIVIPLVHCSLLVLQRAFFTHCHFDVRAHSFCNTEDAIAMICSSRLSYEAQGPRFHLASLGRKQLSKMYSQAEAAHTSRSANVCESKYYMMLPENLNDSNSLSKSGNRNSVRLK